MTKMKNLYGIRDALERVIEPVALLLVRIYMFNVFFTSGYSKLQNWLNDDWSTTILLFEEIHPVPYIPAEFAAVLGTGGEVVLSLMLLVGLFSRFAAFGLLIMTAVIEWSFHFVDASYITFESHYMWALLLAVIVVRGAGFLSADRIMFTPFSMKSSG